MSLNFVKTLAWIFYLIGNLTIISLFCFGLLLIIGGLKHWSILFNFPDTFFFPVMKSFQKLCGDKGLKYFYSIDGLLLSIVSIWLLISFNEGGFP